MGDSDPFFQMRTLRVREGGDSALGPTIPAHFPWPPWPPLAHSGDTADSLAGDGCFGLLISSGDGFPCTVHTPLSAACLCAGRPIPTRQLARDPASVPICGLRGLGQPRPPSPRPEPGVGHCGSPGGGGAELAGPPGEECSTFGSALFVEQGGRTPRGGHWIRAPARLSGFSCLFLWKFSCLGEGREGLRRMTDVSLKVTQPARS